MSRVIGSVRVSTEDQAREGVSLEAQRERIRAYCLAMELELVEIVTDEGVSGAVSPEKRPGLASALARCRAGDVDGIVVYRLDRLTRSVRDLLDLVDEVQGARWSLHAVVDRLDTGSATGRLMLGLLGLLSQWERETIAERTTMALAEKRRQGAHLGGVPYGWRRAVGPDGKLTALEQVPEEQATIGQVRAWLKQGRTQAWIASTLNANSEPSRSGRPWSRRGIQCILSQPSVDGSMDEAAIGQEA